MTIYAYFFDSVDGDKPYSAADFARAFGVILQTGVLSKRIWWGGYRAFY